MARISILLPTKGRPPLVYRLFDSLTQTTSNIDGIEIILYMDEDDVASHDLSYPPLNVIKLIRPAGNSIGKILNECYKASNGHYVILMNDDAVFRTPGWDLTVMKAFSRFSDEIAFVYGNDLDQGKRVPTFPILSRKVCEIIRGICPEEYLNLHIESHLFDIFNQLKGLGHNRIVYLKDVIIEHLHYVLGKAERDGIYVKKNPSADEKLFVALAEERKDMAGRLAQYIEGWKGNGIEISEKGETTFQGEIEPVVSVVIPAFHDEIDRSSWSLDSIVNRTSHQIPYEVIITMSGGPTGNLLFNLQWKVKMIQNGEGASFAKICNRGAQRARGDFLVFMISSAVPLPGWMDAMMKVAKTQDDIAVVGCKHLNSRNGRIHHAGISFFNDEGELKITYIYRGVRSNHPIVNRLREFQAVSAACMLVKKDAFLEVGGFDETLNCLEDIDLCLRIRERGMKVVYTPEATVYLYRDLPYMEDKDYLQNSSMLVSRWKDKIEMDLDGLLEEDGFSLCKTDNPYLEVKPMILKALKDEYGREL